MGVSFLVRQYFARALDQIPFYKLYNFHFHVLSFLSLKMPFYKLYNFHFHVLSHLSLSLSLSPPS